MQQERFFRSKLFILGIVASVSLLVFPHYALGQASPGSLTGIIYWENQKSPMEGAIVKLRNVLTGAVYQSEATDKNGSYIIKNIPEGRYIIGVNTQKGYFNFDRELQIKALESAKLSLVLKVDKKGLLVAGALGGAAAAAGAGAATAAGFFATPIGIAVAVAALAAGEYGIYSALGQEEKSPARR